MVESGAGPSWLTSQKRPETSGLFKRHAAWKGASLSWRDSICPKSLIVLRFVLGWHLLDLYDAFKGMNSVLIQKWLGIWPKAVHFFLATNTLSPQLLPFGLKAIESVTIHPYLDPQLSEQRRHGCLSFAKLECVDGYRLYPWIILSFLNFNVHSSWLCLGVATANVDVTRTQQLSAIPSPSRHMTSSNHSGRGFPANCHPTMVFPMVFPESRDEKPPG